MRRSRRQSRLLILAAGATLWAAAASGQTASISISPLRIEAAVIPGVEKTVSFELFTPASPDGDAGRVVLNLTDWTIREDGSADYTEPGTQPNSASAWVRFSPAAVTLRAGQRQLVRVTILKPHSRRKNAAADYGNTLQNRAGQTAASGHTDLICKPWKNFGEMRQFFERIRERVGETRYFEELGIAGVNNPAHFRSANKALECYSRLMRIAAEPEVA